MYTENSKLGRTCTEKMVKFSFRVKNVPVTLLIMCILKHHMTYQCFVFDSLCIYEPLFTSLYNHRLLSSPVIRVTVYKLSLV